MQEVKLTRAEIGDIPAISELARLIWNQHYPSIIGRHQIDYMLDLMYSESSLEDQMKNKGHIFYFVSHKKKRIGFISVSQESKGNWFIGKFYINQELAGKGMGTVAFEELKKTIRPSTMSLTVNRQNFKSINFYFKMGFRIERIADFDIGNGFVMNDFVMKWEGNKD